MYRYEVSESVRDAINSHVGRPLFYEDTDGKWYINHVERMSTITYLNSFDQFVSETLDQICQTIYSTDFISQSTQVSYTNVETVSLTAEDSDTGGVKFSPKYAPDGWKQQLFETELETSNHLSLHEKDWQNNDIGWSTLKFYDSNDTELVQGAQDDATYAATLIAQCTRTDLEWMPDIDYMIKGGFIGQITVSPQDCYAWVQGAVLPDAYGGPQATFAEGGLNMAYVAGHQKVGLDGVAGTILYYTHPQLGPGVGTNKLRYIFRHPAGYKHRFQCIMDIFRR